VFADSDRFAELVARPSVRLDEAPFALLLAAHHAQESSGLLVATRGPIEKKVLLDQGVPVDCRSNLVHETLSRFLAARGRLSNEDANTALARSVAQGKLLGEMLVEEGTLGAEELQRLLQESLARKLFDLFAWKDGEVSFEPGTHRSETAARMKVPRLIVTGIERFMSQAAVDRLAGAIVGTLLVVDPQAPARLPEVRPSARELAVLDALAKPHRFEEIATNLGAEPDELSRLLLALALVGLVAPAERVARRSEAVPSQPPPPIAAPVPGPPPPAGASAQVERLRERVLRKERERAGQDPFEFFGLADGASLDEIRESYAAFARQFGPWRFLHPDLADVAEPARELFFFGAICFSRLADPNERERLRAERRRRRDAAVEESKKSYFRIETDLLDAETQFKKGHALLEAGKRDLALQQLEFAADCDPQNGAYLAEAAWCRYLLAPSTKAADSLAELRDAQRTDPRAVEPLLYGGYLLADLERYTEAELMLRKAAKLLGPDDRRALDKLHELGQRKRKKR